MMLDYEWGAATAMPPFSDEFGGETGQERAAMFDHYVANGIDTSTDSIGGCITDFIPQLQPQSAAAMLFSPPSSACSFNQRYGLDLPGIGLNLGVRTYFSSSSASSFLAPEKAAGTLPGGRVSRRRTRTARCQAEGCVADLAHAKHYHRRHKVCEFHSKASVVMTAGLAQRFCQQCSRFHVLGEFDQGKRSCRKRLAEHNRRRRKSQDLTTSCARNKNESIDTASTKNIQKPEMVLFNDPSSGSNGSTTRPSLPSPATPPQYHSQTKMALHLGSIAEGDFSTVQMGLSESTAAPSISFFSQLSGRSAWE